MRTHKKTRTELAFLPAVLEIQETPPLPISRYILYAIMLFFSIAIVWAWVSKLDIVSVAAGKIVPSGRVKIIQPVETGVVTAIYVRQGDVVQAGDVLVELDPTLIDADQTQNKERHQLLVLERARLLTLMARVDDEVQTDYFAELTAIAEAKKEIQRQRVISQYDEYTANITALKKEKTRAVAERRTIKGRIEQLDAVIPLISERAASLRSLLESNMAPRVRWLELEQERIEQVKERAIQAGRIDIMDALIASIDQRQLAHKADFRERILAELTDVESKIAAFEQEMVKAARRMTLYSLRAPVAGTVHQLLVHTVGGVVTPAQELMRTSPMMTSSR